MTRTERIKAAAARYGLTDPSPDDVLMVHWTLYNHDAIHTAGYHADYDAVVREVEALGLSRSRAEVACKICGDPIPEASRRNSRYCSMACRRTKAGDYNRRRAAA